MAVTLLQVPVVMSAVPLESSTAKSSVLGCIPAMTVTDTSNVFPVVPQAISSFKDERVFRVERRVSARIMLEHPKKQVLIRADSKEFRIPSCEGIVACMQLC